MELFIKPNTWSGGSKANPGGAPSRKEVQHRLGHRSFLSSFSSARKRNLHPSALQTLRGLLHPRTPAVPDHAGSDRLPLAPER